MMMFQVTPASGSSSVQIVTLIVGAATTMFTAWIAYKQFLAKQVQDNTAKKVEEVHSLVNGSLGTQLQTGLTSAKALAVADPTDTNVALADNAQQAMDAHNAAQAVILKNDSNGAK